MILATTDAAYEVTSTTGRKEDVVKTEDPNGFFDGNHPYGREVSQNA